MNFKISFAVTACNEHDELNRLLLFLYSHKRECDEIVVQIDDTNHTNEILSVLNKFKLPIHKFPLNNDFSSFKNNLKKICKGNYIFQIDADEIPALETVSNLHNIIESNIDIDLFLVPRINTVQGLTEKHIQKWNWQINQKQWVNWPDYQFRIFKNQFNIKWVNEIHEQIVGAQTGIKLPASPEYALIHEKTIDKQEKQNAFYDSING